MKKNIFTKAIWIVWVAISTVISSIASQKTFDKVWDYLYEKYDNLPVSIIGGLVIGVFAYLSVFAMLVWIISMCIIRVFKSKK